jgi:hypothetical protein
MLACIARLAVMEAGFVFVSDWNMLVEHGVEAL